MNTNSKNGAENFPSFTLPTFVNERKINLVDHVLSVIDGDNDIIVCGAYIKINATPLNSMEPITIPTNKLASLYNAAETLRTENAADITGLRFIFGVENGQIYLLYQPVCFKLKCEAVDPRFKNQGIFEIIDHSSIYHFYEGDFSVYTAHSSRVTDYQQKFEIVRKKKDGFKRFQTGDVESVIFSFQEIFELLDDNESSELRIYNAIRRVIMDPDFEMRHSLVLASIKTSPAYKEGNFENKYANLAHLCPPNCPKVIYPLER